MGENLFCPGQKAIYNTDSWYSIFRGIPKMNSKVESMLKDYIKEGKPENVFLFFYETCEYSSDYSAYLMRQFEQGEI